MNLCSFMSRQSFVNSTTRSIYGFKKVKACHLYSSSRDVTQSTSPVSCPLSVFVCLSDCLGQCEYEDSIEFQGKDGSFQVSLRATIPCPALEVPDSVLLPLCAVQHCSNTTFLLRNVRYIWVCFRLTQKSGGMNKLGVNVETYAV